MNMVAMIPANIQKTQICCSNLLTFESHAGTTATLDSAKTKLENALVARRERYDAALENQKLNGILYMKELLINSLDSP
jgi:hypothetical protein